MAIPHGQVTLAIPAMQAKHPCGKFADVSDAFRLGYLAKCWSVSLGLGRGAAPLDCGQTPFEPLMPLGLLTTSGSNTRSYPGKRTSNTFILRGTSSAHTSILTSAPCAEPALCTTHSRAARQHQLCCGKCCAPKTLVRLSLCMIC